MYFPSKKDLWLYPIYWGSVIVCFIPLFIGRDFITLFFTIPFAIMLIWCWFTTGYKVSDEVLVIQSGPIKQNILIKDIKKSKAQKIHYPLSHFQWIDLK